MATIRKTITLSDGQDAWIKSRIKSGAFTNDSEYIRDLVRRDQAHADQLAEVRAAVSAGVQSGRSNQTLKEIWADAERRHRAANA